ncbi:MAG: glucodextranase DOMON-like domain-containing protein [Desulfurococcaceae archaeon]
MIKNYESKLAIILLLVLVLINIGYIVETQNSNQQENGTQYQEFILTDPEGDDNGIGSLIYPTNPVFVEGAFDLVNFTILVDEYSVYFKATMRDLGGNPWNGRNGFSLQYIQIYVLTTNETLPKSNTTYGLNITIYYGWHYAILVNGGWGDTPLPEGELPAIYDGNETLVAVEGELYDVYVDETQPNTIVARVNKTLLLDVENIGNWTILVAVASYDGFGYMRVRGVQSGDPGEWVFGGADLNAILSGVHPLVIDLLAPTPEDQYLMLTNWNIELGLKPLVGRIVVSTGELLLPPIITPTPTPTPTPSPTPTETTPTPSPTPSPTPTPTETTPTITEETTPIETTPTPTPTPSPSPTPATSPETTPAAEVPSTLIALIIIVIIVIIVVLIYLLRKTGPSPKPT